MPAPWFEDDLFWTQFAPLMFNEERWALADREVEALIRLTGIKPPSRVLDTCCGVGRHSLAFAARGFQVTGVDRTATFLEAARESSEAEHYTIEFILEDMRKYRKESYFDVALNLFTSFGYFESEQDESRLLDNVHASLKPGGKFVLDLMGKEILARDFKGSEWFEEKNSLVLQEHRILGDWERLENRWIIIRAGKMVDYTFSHRVYSAVELSTLLKKAGFSDISFFGGLDGIPYDEHARRLIAVAKRRGRK